MKSLTPNETDIIRLISDWLSLMKIPHWRFNSGAATGRYQNRQGFVKKRFVRFIRILFPKNDELKFPDLQLIYKGVQPFIEVKRPGLHKDEPGQDAFLRMIIRGGGYGAKITCLEEMETIIEDISRNHSRIKRNYEYNGYGLK